MADAQGRQGGDEYFADLDLIESVMNEKELQGIDLIDDHGIGGEGEGEADPDASDREEGQDDEESESAASHDSDYDSEISDQNEDDDDVTEEFAGGIRAQRRSVAAAAAAAAKLPTDSSPSIAAVPVRPSPVTAAAEQAPRLLGASAEGVANAPSFDLSAYFGEEELFIIDAKTKGNIGRYMNHSCDPNLLVQHVLVDTHDLRLPWVAFFTKKRVMAGEELCWDYNYEIGGIPGRRIDCKCCAQNCRGRLL